MSNTVIEFMEDSARYKRQRDHLLEVMLQIAGLRDAKEMRGELVEDSILHLGHVVDNEGWMPISPQIRTGLNIAARMAAEAVEEANEMDYEQA